MTTNLSKESGSPGQKERYTHGYGSAAAGHMARRTASQSASFLLPHLRPGMSLLDCGCGPGTITVGLAEAVSPGEVVGIDIEANQIELAYSHSAQQGIKNVRFEAASVYELPFADASFEAIFSNTVLEHIADPPKALLEMYRVLKPGGVIGVSDSDASAHVISPADPAIERCRVLRNQLWQLNGGNPNLGRALRGLVHKAGFERVEASASFDSYGSAELTRYWGEAYARHLTESDFAEKVVSLGWASKEEVEAMAESWRAWGQKPDAIWAMASCDVLGWKPKE